VTQQSAIIDDPKYRAVLDHGFVGIVDHMGSDAAIVQAARVSYGAGTKAVSEDRGLIRYLLRHQHSTPLEMCEIKFHVRAPIFVIRQWIRHRTASTNEESGRYSEMSDEFYMPEPQHILPQATDNKQGRAGELSDQNKEGTQWLIEAGYDHSHKLYKILLGDREGDDPENPGLDILYNPYGSEYTPALLDQDFKGVAREVARIVMPLGSYSEFYWKLNLWNLFRFLHLRSDPHAQYEIRAFAEAMTDLARPLFPNAFEAADDYLFKAAHMSRMDVEIIKAAIAHPEGLSGLEASYGGVKETATHYGMVLREYRELKQRLG